MNYRAELNRRKYLKQLVTAASRPVAVLNLQKLILLFVSFLLFLGATFIAIPRGLSYLQSTSSPLKQQANESDLQVAQLIQNVEDQLAEAERERASKNQAALFRVKSFDLEVNFVVKQDNSLQGATTYNVVTVDNQVDASTEMTQTLTLHMEVPPPQPEQSLDPALWPPIGQITTIGPDPFQIVGGVGRSLPGETHEKPHSAYP